MEIGKYYERFAASPKTKFLSLKEGVLDIEDFTAYRDATTRVNSAINEAGREGRDISMMEAVGSINGQWEHHAANNIIESVAVDFDDISCLDWWNSYDGGSMLCPDHYGSILAAHAQGVAVELGTPVTHIDWGGSGVKVETSAGTINCKAVIVTASVGVLAAEKIKFTPALPLIKQEAFHNVRMGVYNNIALQFSEDIFGFGQDAYVDYNNGDDRGGEIMTNLGGTNEGGKPLSFMYSGGSHGRELELAGIDAAVEYGLFEIVNMYGSDVKKKFIKGYMTRWGENPWSLGCYSAARPGYFHLRKELRVPEADKLFFAGEAGEPTEFGSCHGGYLNGIRMANKVIDVL